MANTTNSSSGGYDPIQMLRDFLKDTPDAPAFLNNYLINRLGDQIIWYDKKSSFFKKKYEGNRRIVIILSATIPFLVGLIGTDFFGTPSVMLDTILKLTVGVAGVVIAVIEGYNQLYKSQEHYVGYRTTAEKLKQEFSFFLGGGGKYEGLTKETSYATLIANCESIVANENSGWSEVVRNNEKAAQSKELQNAMQEFLDKYGVMAPNAKAEDGGEKPE